jgi:hypothetical protein
MRMFSTSALCPEVVVDCGLDTARVMPAQLHARHSSICDLCWTAVACEWREVLREQLQQVLAAVQCRLSRDMQSPYSSTAMMI